MEQSKRRLVSNTIYMYILSFAKLIIPLISLPYLTKVLSVQYIGGVSFVKSFVSYTQVIVDFGFVLSATKDLVALIKNKENPNKTIGNTIYAQMLLCAVAIVGMLICVLTIDALAGFELYAMLSIIPVVLSVFLFEYVFRAYEKMEKITLRFVVMRSIALILTIIFVKDDSQIILMPIFDIISMIVAIGLVHFQMKKLGVKCDFSFLRFKQAVNSLRRSWVYGVSNFITTAFTLLNTVVIGIMLTKECVAYWTVAFQFMSAINAMYTPIISSVYPVMLKERNLKTIHQIMAIFMPIIILGSVAIYFLSDWFVITVFGDVYKYSGTVIRWIIPVVIATFPSLLYGWPCLSVINKEKTNTVIAVIGAVIQVVGIVILITTGAFSLINLAIVRGVVECLVAISRVVFVYRNRKLFATVSMEDIPIAPVDDTISVN